MNARAIVTPRPRLLILRALGLGDFLTAVPALRALARAFPNHYRILAMPVALAPLAAKSGTVDEVVDARPFDDLDPAVRNAEIAVNMHGCGPQSHTMLLRTRPHRLIAYANDRIPETHGMPQWSAGEHETARWCRLLEESGIAADPAELDIAVSPDPRYQGAIILHAGAASESRRWPSARWIELAGALRERGHRVIFTGTPGEFRRVRTIARAAGIPVHAVLAGKTDVGELAAIVAAARAIVCGDTGIAHLATAVRTPSVVLFGPTSPQNWGPPRRPYHRTIWHGTLGDPHAATVDPGLASITVAEVSNQLHALLNVPKAV